MLSQVGYLELSASRASKKQCNQFPGIFIQLLPSFTDCSLFLEALSLQHSGLSHL